MLKIIKNAIPNTIPSRRKTFRRDAITHDLVQFRTGNGDAVCLMQKSVVEFPEYGAGDQFRIRKDIRFCKLRQLS